MKFATTNVIMLTAAAGLLAGCGSVKLPSLGSSTASTAPSEIAAAKKATASLSVPSTPGAATPVAAAPGAQPAKPADPLAKPLRVAATSARASKCGFYFNATQLRQGYIDHEASLGASEKRVAVLTKIYDVANKRIAAEIKDNDSYCNADRIAKTRLLLTKYVAGDYAYEPPKKNRVVYEDDGKRKPIAAMTTADAFGETFQPDATNKP